MAAVVHISEKEGAKDFGALMEHVRSGDEVRLERRDGARAVLRRTNEDDPIRARNIDEIIDEIIDGLKERKERQGLAVLDADFAANVAEARARYNAPRDHLAWD